MDRGTKVIYFQVDFLGTHKFNRWPHHQPFWVANYCYQHQSIRV